MHKKFIKKSIQNVHTYNSFRDILSRISGKMILRIFVLCICIGLIIWFGKYIGIAASYFGKKISQTTMQVVSTSLGTKMATDAYGNINVLLIGFGGEQHAGGYLADSVIVASFSPENNSISMISIPRDLYIYEKGRYANRINAVFAFEHNKSQGNLDVAAQALATKVSEIVGLDIPYYALVDFGGFEKVVNTIGGLKIQIPYTVHDTQYPEGKIYTTFHLDAGEQILDGATALKYARSRHSTSDFSRSQRQQLIIKAIVKQIMEQGVRKNISSMQALYEQYTKMVFTNIELEEMLWGLQFATEMPEIFTFGYTMECMDLSYKTMQPGCLLYPGVQAEFNGMSVLIPRGASGRNPSYYVDTQFFAYMVAHHPGFLKEKAKIHIYNGIDTAYAKKFRYRDGLATKLATKLIRYGFTVNEADNTDASYEETTVVIHGTGAYENTLKMLQLFFEFRIEEPAIQESIVVGTGTEILEESLVTDEIQSDIDIFLGNDFIDRFGNQQFDTYGH